LVLDGTKIPRFLADPLTGHSEPSHPVNGLVVTEIIWTRFPKTKVLFISMHNNPDYVV